MSTQIAASLGAILIGNARQVVRTAGGTLYAVVVHSSKIEVYKSTNGASWANQDSTHSPTAFAGVVACAIDATGVIHIAYAKNAAPFNYKETEYSTFDTSTDLFVTTETAIASVTGTTVAAVAIAVDSNNIPHITMSGQTSTDDRFIYTNRIGGTWKTAISVALLGSSATAPSLDMLIDNNNLPQIAYFKTSAFAAAAIGNLNNATSFTVKSLSTTAVSGAVSIAMDTSNNTWVSYVGASNSVTLIEHLSGDAWSTWQTPISNSGAGKGTSLAINGSNVYVFYEKNSNSNIVFDRYSGTWLGETVLESGTYHNVRAKWAELNNNQGATQIDFLFDDGSSISWDAYVIPTAPTVTTQAVSSVAATTATGNGNITSTGNTTPDKRGVVYSTTSHSDPGNTAPASSVYESVSESTGSFSTGAFTQSLTGLVSRTTYYARAYAHNALGYSYGSEVSFTTIGFTNPGNVYASDNVYATLAASSGDLTVELSKDGGTNYHNALVKTFNGSDSLLTYGNGATELWGTSWTRADMVDSLFRIRVSQGNISQVYKTFGFTTGSDTLTGIEVAIEAKFATSTISIDLIKVKIYYGTSILPVQAGSTAYASNGRKNGEGAASGTGVLAFYDGTAWRAVDTGATVAA